MRTLNRGVAFVLVLFGSVVPASAQDLQGYAGVVQTVVVSVSVVFGVVVTLLAFWWKFDARLDQTNRRIDDAKKELKADAQKAHAEIATSIRESEKRLSDSIDKVTSIKKGEDQVKMTTVELTAMTERDWGGAEGASE